MSSQDLLIRLARRYPGHILLNILMGFSGAIFNGVSTALLIPVILNLLGQQTVLKSGPPILSKLLSLFEVFPEEQRLYAMAGVVLALIALKNLSSYINMLTANAFSRALTSDMQEEGIKMLLEVDIGFFSTTRAGDLANRLGGEMARAASAASAIIGMIVASITILVFLVILLSISWQLTLLSTVLLVFTPLMNQFWIQRSKRFGKDLSRLASDYTSSLLEILGGIRLVKATGNEMREYERMKYLIRAREQIEFQSRMNSGAIGPINEVTNIGALLLLVFAGRTIFSNQDVDNIAAILSIYLVVLLRLLPQIAQLNSTRDSLARAGASAEVVADLLDRDNKPFMLNGAHRYSPLKQGIGFEHIGFRYATTNEIALDDIDLFLPCGTTLALVGASGAGKSTLADLVPRFFDPTSGRITLDGRDLREFDITSLRRSMGIVSQDTFLFNNSVRYNIAYHNPDASDQEVIEAAKRANAHEFIERLPQGFETQIGDRGVMLSGGQRQRIAIARALLQNPDLLILDEATSALDTVSERLVQEAIEELSRERTTLVIAHRLSTVQKADQIAVMERGRVVELGTHEELLKRNGHYSRLYAMQFSEESRTEPAPLIPEVAEASYQLRAHLNSMLGSTRFLADGLTDSPQDQAELAESAYSSALAMLKTLETLEQLKQPQSP